eukprot:UN01050
MIPTTTTTSQINNIPPVIDNGVNHQPLNRNSVITTSLPSVLLGNQTAVTHGGAGNYNNNSTNNNNNNNKTTQPLNPPISSQKPSWAPSVTAPYPTLGGAAFAKQQLGSKPGGFCQQQIQLQLQVLVC